MANKQAGMTGGMRSQASQYTQNPYLRALRRNNQRASYVFPELPYHPEKVYKWVRDSITGRPDAKNLNDKMHGDEYQKWVPVKQGEIPEIEHLFRDGFYRVIDTVLLEASRQLEVWKQEAKGVMAENMVKEMKQDAMDSFMDNTGKRLGMIEDTLERVSAEKLEFE